MDFGRPFRRQLIDSTPEDRAAFNDHRLDEKRRRALSYLGENWVLHPNYKTNPRHNPANRAATL